MRAQGLLTLLVSLSSALTAAQEAPSIHGYRSLEQRRSTAQAAIELREAFFAGESEPRIELEQAFPSLSGAPLADPNFLKARRRELDRIATDQAGERIEGSETRLADRLASALDAEEAADALEQQLLTRLEAGLTLAPGYRQDAMAKAIAILRERRRIVEEGPDEDPDPSVAVTDPAEMTAALTLAAAQAEQMLVLHQADALRRMAIPTDQRLVTRVLVDLDVAEADVHVMDRLERARPLLPEELRLVVADVLESRRTAEADREVEPEVDERDPDPGSPLEAEILAATRELAEQERVRRQESLEAVSEREAESDRLAQTTAAARALSLLDRTRERRLARNFEALRTLATELRAIALDKDREQRAALSDHRATIARWSETAGVDRAWHESLIALEAVLARRDENLEAESARWMKLLQSVLTAQRDLLPYVDYTTQRSELVDEVRAELQTASLWFRHNLRDEIRYVQTMPDRVFDLDAWWNLIRVSFDLLLLFVFWAYLRKAAGRGLRRAIDSSRSKELSLFGWQDAPRRIENREIDTIASYGIAALGALALHFLLLPRSEILAFAALLWVSWAVVKSVPPAVRVVAVLSSRALDPLTGISPSSEIEARAVATFSRFVWWWAVSTVLAFATVPLLQADALRDLIGIASVTIFVALILYSLMRWESWILDFIRQLADQNRLTAWLGRSSPSRARRIIRAGLGVVFIAARVVFWFLVDLGWISHSSTQLVASAFTAVEPNTEMLSPEDRGSIADAETSLIERKEELKALDSALTDWTRERRLGVIAVVGDRGMGKTAFLEAAGEKLRATSELEVTFLRAEPHARSKSYSERFRWMTEPLGLEVASNAGGSTVRTALIDHLESLPPRIFLVDDLHFLLRRVVGGFGSLQSVLHVIQTCSDDHFWVLSLHQPAWSYVDSVSVQSTIVFRDRIELKSLGPEALESSILAQTRNAGFEPDFKQLLPSSPSGPALENTESKAQSMYWRVLAQTSHGNPGIALEYWLSSLGQAESGTNEDRRSVPVFLSPGHADKEVQAMSDEFLFLLTAIVIHDGLRIKELADVLNISVSKARTACQQLMSLNILERDSDRFIVSPSWQPMVLRVLDRKNFAHR